MTKNHIFAIINTFHIRPNKHIIMNIKFTEEFFSKIVSGDEPSFTLLYRSFYSKLYYFSYQYLIDREASKDVVQEVFTELWDHKDSLNEKTNLQAWLYTVAKNKSLKYIEKLQSQNNYSEYIKYRQLDVNYKALSELDTGKLAYEELDNIIQEALNKLSPVCRKVFEMSRFEELSNKEIAHDLNLSIKTIESHISKALRLLRVELKDYLPFLMFLFYMRR